MGPTSTLILCCTVAAAWLVALVDAAVLVLSAPATDGHVVRAMISAGAYATLLGLFLGLVGLALAALRRRFGTGEPGWSHRTLARLSHPLTVLSVLWIAVGLDLTTGAGISASKWRVPVFFVLVVGGGSGMVVGTWLARRAWRSSSRLLRLASALALVGSAGVAYASGFLYPNSYYSAHAFMLLLCISAIGLALSQLLEGWQPARPRGWLTALGMLAAAAVVVLLVLPLQGTARALAFRHAQSVRHVIYQSSQLFGGSQGRQIEYDAEAGAEFEAAALPPCTDRPQRDHDIIFISVDSLRADRLGATSPNRVVMPRIDDLGHRGLVFTAGYSPSPSTATSLVPLISGTSALALRELGRIPSTLATELKQLGYQTISFEPFSSVSRRTFPGVSPKKLGFAKAKRAKSASKFADQVIELLGVKPRKPLFIYAHLLEPHVSYQKHKNFNFGSTMVDRYDSEVAYVDHHIGRIVDEVDRLGRRDRTVIAITADHAEAFYEHGLMGHGLSLYEEMIRVPIVIAASELEPSIDHTRVSALDIAPTLLSLLGCGWSTPVEGSPLWAAGALQQPSPVVVVRQYNEHERGRNFVRRVATLVGNDKLIEDLLTDVDEVYDLEADPAEASNLASTAEATIASLRESNRQARRKIGWFVAKNAASVESELSRRVRAGAAGATRDALARIIAEPRADTSLALVDALAQSPDADGQRVLLELTSRPKLPAGLQQRVVRGLAEDGQRDLDGWIELARSAELADAARSEVFTFLSEDEGRGRETLEGIASSDPSATIAAAAAAELCRSDETADDLGPLVRRRFAAPEDLAKVPVQSVRTLLACLGRAPTDDDIDYLFAIYDTPVAKKKHSVYVIIEALGNASNDRPLKRLVELSSHHWEPVRAAAVRSLAKLGTPGATAFFTDLARSNKHLELGASLVHAELVESAVKQAAVWPVEGAMALSTPSGGAPGDLEKLSAAVDEQLSQAGSPALLALHLRRVTRLNKPGKVSIGIGKADPILLPVLNFPEEQSSPIYLQVGPGDVKRLSVSYSADDTSALEVTGAELLWP